MSYNRILNWIKTNEIKKDVWVIPIILLAGILTFLPHIEYSFLFHIDEWYHIAQAKQFVLGSEINWYNGEQFYPGLESGWHVLLGIGYFLFNITSKQWIYIPSILHILAIISTYLFTSRFFDRKKGLITAFLIAIIPSNNTIGGPVFLIPVNLSLILLPLTLIFTFNLVKIKTLYKHLIIILLTTFLLYAHAPSAIVLLMILFFHTLFQLFSRSKKSQKKGLYLLSSILISILLSIPNFLNEIFTRGLDSITFNFYIKLNEIFLLYGVLPTLFFIIGFYFLSKEKSKEIWALLITALLLLINIVVFARLGINFILPYQRTFIPLFLIMAIIASIGFSKLLEIQKPIPRIGMVLFFVMILATGVIAVNSNLNYQYYQIIDETDYENGQWIKENTEIDDILICDPWKARALAPISERQVHAVTPFGPVEEEVALMEKAKDFLNNDCRNTSYLIAYNISIVYARGYNCYNPFLKEYSNDIYLFEK